VKARIVEAFERARQGYSVDRVIADPELNAAFLEECRSRGIQAESATLNRSLLNLRKAGGLRSIKSKRTSFDDDEYRFAAEMAIRFIERRDGVTLDEVICDPVLASEFDALAAKVSPGFSPLQYRWAALSLRKGNRLTPEILARVAPPVAVLVFAANELKLADVPLAQGLYIYFTATECLYIGEAENLRNRTKRHLDHSDNKGLAQWMWRAGIEQLFVEFQVLEAATTTKVRRALELELIRSRQPVFNVNR
jgi:hypothetical protein